MKNEEEKKEREVEVGVSVESEAILSSLEKKTENLLSLLVLYLLLFYPIPSNLIGFGKVFLLLSIFFY